MEFTIDRYRDNLANIVRRSRRAQDLTQEALGDLAGVSERTVINIEAGNYKSLTLTTIQAVTKALKISAWMRLEE